LEKYVADLQLQKITSLRKFNMLGLLVGNSSVQLRRRNLSTWNISQDIVFPANLLVNALTNYTTNNEQYMNLNNKMQNTITWYFYARQINIKMKLNVAIRQKEENCHVTTYRNLWKF